MNTTEIGNELKDLDKVGMDRLVEIAEETGHFLSNEKLKMNQIRRFLDGVRRIESELKGRTGFQHVQDAIILLRPKLAYAAGRERKIKPLMEVLDPAIKSGAKSEENFHKLLRLIEGIVAYHRFHGGLN
ncbi:MAG: type III-A CRISPR-associated protein Csm2 [Desulfobacterota bacterium]|jgi:CRISPR-associated protein Csm2|nr:type III-A CRISPR-associated protein Csm2 [Thermodesulfobacteriota bacterium]